MYRIIEIIIISLMGLGSAGFMVWYFFASSRKQKKCSNCAFCNIGNFKRMEFIDEKEKKIRDKRRKNNLKRKII